MVSLAKRSSASLTSCEAEQSKLHLAVLRIQAIRDTSFIASAYAILDLFTAGTVLSLLLIEAEDFGKSLALTSFLYTAFIYWQLLIQDLDNPFEYHGKSTADVSLLIIESTLRRLQGRLLQKKETFKNSETALTEGSKSS